MRCSLPSLIASLLFLAPSASALQDLRLEFEAVVTQAAASQPGALQLVVGSTLEVNVEVLSNGIPSGPFAELYSSRRRVGGIRGGALSVTVNPIGPQGFVFVANNDPLHQDRLVFQQFLSTGDIVRIDIDDPTLTMFSSTDLASQQGTLPVSSGAVATIHVDAAIGTPLLTATIQSLTIGEGGGLGMPFCQTSANSTGVPGQLQAMGSHYVGLNNFQLLATLLPANQFGYAVSSPVQAISMNPTGGPMLCLGGPFVGRHLAALGNTGSTGSLLMQIDLASFPQLNSVSPVVAGQTLNFQFWHRDIPPAFITSLTDGISVTFR